MYAIKLVEKTGLGFRGVMGGVCRWYCKRKEKGKTKNFKWNLTNKREVFLKGDFLRRERKTAIFYSKTENWFCWNDQLVLED